MRKIYTFHIELLLALRLETHHRCSTDLRAVLVPPLVSDYWTDQLLYLLQLLVLWLIFLEILTHLCQFQSTLYKHLPGAKRVL